MLDDDTNHRYPARKSNRDKRRSPVNHAPQRATDRPAEMRGPSRAAKQGDWNRPLWWPLGLVAVLALLGFFFARKTLRRRERMNARGEILA